MGKGVDDKEARAVPSLLVETDTEAGVLSVALEEVDEEELFSTAEDNSFSSVQSNMRESVTRPQGPKSSSRTSPLDLRSDEIER